MMVRGRRKEEGVAKRNRERGRGSREGKKTDKKSETTLYIYLSFYRLINWARHKGTSIHFDLLLDVFLDISFHHC